MLAGEGQKEPLLMLREFTREFVHREGDRTYKYTFHEYTNALCTRLKYSNPL